MFSSELMYLKKRTLLIKFGIAECRMFIDVSGALLLMSDRSCSGDEDRENIDRLRASSEQHKRQLRSNQLDVRQSEQKIKDLTINIRYRCCTSQLTYVIQLCCI